MKMMRQNMIKNKTQKLKETQRNRNKNRKRNTNNKGNKGNRQRIISSYVNPQ